MQQELVRGQLGQPLLHGRLWRQALVQLGSQALASIQLEQWPLVSGQRGQQALMQIGWQALCVPVQLEQRALVPGQLR